MSLLLSILNRHSHDIHSQPTISMKHQVHMQKAQAADDQVEIDQADQGHAWYPIDPQLVLYFWEPSSSLFSAKEGLTERHLTPTLVWPSSLLLSCLLL